jgi:hypothetical protein
MENSDGMKKATSTLVKKNFLNTKVVCNVCGNYFKNKSLKKHKIIKHSSTEQKKEYYKGNYCIECDYGDIQDNKYKIHLETKKHKDKIMDCKIIQGDSDECLFKYLFSRFKCILLEYKYFELINICKLVNGDKISIIITKKHINDKLIALKRKLNNEDIQLTLIDSRVIQTTTEKELLYDYYMKKENGLNYKMSHSLSMILFNTIIDAGMKKLQIDNFISFYSNGFKWIIQTANMLHSVKLINLKVIDKGEFWMELNNLSIKLHKVSAINSSYKCINGLLHHNFNDDDLDAHQYTYCNIICVYKLTVLSNVYYLPIKYRGDHIKICKDKLIDLDDEILNSIRLSNGNFDLKLIACFSGSSNQIEELVMKFSLEYNKSLTIYQNISEFFTTDTKQITEFLENKNVSTEYKIYDYISILERLNGKITGRPKKEFNSPQEKEDYFRLQKINYSRKKFNKGEIHDLEQIKKEERQPLKEEIINLFKSIENLSDKTKENYLAKLTRLQNIGVNIYDFTEVEMNKILSAYEKKNTQQSFLCAIHALFKHTKKDIPKYLQDQIANIQNDINKNIKKNKLSKHQTETCTNWETVLAVRSELEKKYKKYKFKDNLQSYLYLSLYTYLPPRRLEDYRDMIFDNTQEINCEQNNILVYSEYRGEYPENYEYERERLELDDELNNYLVMKNDKCYFVFNMYKTRSSYGKQIVAVPNILAEIIKEYVEMYNLKKGDKLFNYSTSQMGKLMQDIFKKYINKSTCVSNLRHIFVNYYITKKTNNETKEITGLLMGHSKEMQSLYDTVEDIQGDKIINEYQHEEKNEDEVIS